MHNALPIRYFEGSFEHTVEIKVMVFFPMLATQCSFKKTTYIRELFAKSPVCIAPWAPSEYPDAMLSVLPWGHGYYQYFTNAANAEAEAEEEEVGIDNFIPSAVLI